MLGAYKLRTGDLLGEARLGLGMLKRGRLKLLPERTRSRAKVRAMFDGKRKE
jgi:hypothetical protein